MSYDGGDLDVEVNEEKIQYVMQFLFDKGENASWTAEIREIIEDDRCTLAVDRPWAKNDQQFWIICT